MKTVYVLGIDTATLVCGAALVSPDRLLAEYTLHTKKTHSERLLPLIASVLRDCSLSPADLSGVAVAAGPGSFTGVRIGMVTAKALGQALHLPLAAISTLEALAAQYSQFQGVICPILDARRGQVYNALFEPGPLPVRLTEDRAVTLPSLLAELAEKKQPALFLGDGVPVHKDAILKALDAGAVFLPPEAGLNRAATVARLGLNLIEDGQGQSYREIKPVYVRRTEAEMKYLERCAEGGGPCECGH